MFLFRLSSHPIMTPGLNSLLLSNSTAETAAYSVINNMAQIGMERDHLVQTVPQARWGSFGALLVHNPPRLYANTKTHI